MIAAAWQKVMEIDKSIKPNCGKRKFFAAKVSQKPDQIQMNVNPSDGAIFVIKGEWREIWTVNRCGQSISYNIHFFVDEGKFSVDVTFSQ